MKQTNNAIKFLMAQYRSIFKHAYLKGLASAVVLTAGLAAAASAQAETVHLPEVDHNAIITDNSGDNIVIDGEAFFTGGADATSAAATTVTIGQGGSLSNADGAAHALIVKDKIVLDGGSLSLTNGSYFQGIDSFDGTASGFTASLVANNNSDIFIESSIVQVGSATLGEGTNVYIGKTTGGASTNKGWNTASAMLQAQASGAGNTSSMVINGANITIDDDGLLSVNTNANATGVPGATFTMNAGTITLTGSELARRADASSNKYDITNDEIGAAIVSTNSAIANYNGGQVIVQEGDVGQVHGSVMNFKGTTFENSGTMQIGGRLTVNNDLPANEAKGAITMSAGAINNTGTLYLGSAMQYNGETLVSDGSTFTAQGGTITNAAEGSIHIYSKFNANGVEIDNQGNLIVEKDAQFTVNEQKSSTLDGVVSVGGTLQVDGRIDVTHGTLDLSSATAVTSQTDSTTLGKPQGTIVLGIYNETNNNDAVLKITEAQAHDFLNTPHHVSAEQRDSAGSIIVANNSTLDFGDNVTLSDFNFLVCNDTNAQDAKTNPQGYIVVYSDTGSVGACSGAQFKATTMTLNDALLQNATTYVAEDLPATTLIADNLNLHYTGDLSVKDFDGNFSFAKAIVGKNLDVTYEGGDSKLKIANALELSAYTPAVTNNNKTTPAVAESGSITGNDFVVTGESGSINVLHGTWTASPNITLASGASLSVGLELEDNNVVPNTTDSSLALNGGLTFDLAGGNIEVTATGHGFNPLLDEHKANRFSAQLDLTGGLAVINQTSSNSGSITATNGGVITLNAADVNAILDSTDHSETSLNNLGLAATTNGAINVVNGNVSADFTDFSGAASAVAGEVNLSDGGAFITESLALAGDSENSDDDTSLDIGSGVIYTDSLVLTDLRDDVETSYEDGLTKVTLASGTVNVSHSLTTNAADLIVADGATLTLGAEDLLEGTLVANKLTIDGTTIFDHGSWNAASTDFVVGGSLTVGNYDYDAGASLQGDKLTVADDGHVVVLDNGEATFSSIDVSSAGVAAVKVQGNMTINGVSGDMDDDRNAEDHHGVYFGDTTRGADGVFYVDGSTAKLEFGAEASKAFYNTANQTAEHGVQADDKGNINTVYVESYAQNSLTVNDGGTVKLNLGDQTFNKQQIFSLKEQLFRAVRMKSAFDILTN